jgi:hypothetical protein
MKLTAHHPCLQQHLRFHAVVLKYGSIWLKTEFPHNEHILWVYAEAGCGHQNMPKQIKREGLTLVGGFNIGLNDHFNTQLVITINYSAIANFHTLQTTERVLLDVSWLTAPYNAYSSDCVFKSSPNGGSQLPLLTSITLLYNPFARTE